MRRSGEVLHEERASEQQNIIIRALETQPVPAEYLFVEFIAKDLQNVPPFVDQITWAKIKEINMAKEITFHIQPNGLIVAKQASVRSEWIMRSVFYSGIPSKIRLEADGKSRSILRDELVRELDKTGYAPIKAMIAFRKGSLTGSKDGYAHIYPEITNLSLGRRFNQGDRQLIEDWAQKLGPVNYLKNSI